MRLAMMFVVLVVLGCSAGNSSEPPLPTEEASVIIELKETASPTPEVPTGPPLARGAAESIEAMMVYQHQVMSIQCARGEFPYTEIYYFPRRMEVNYNFQQLEVTGFILTYCFQMNKSNFPVVLLPETVTAMAKAAENAAMKEVYPDGNVLQSIPYPQVSVSMSKAAAEVIPEEYKATGPVVNIVFLSWRYFYRPQL